MIDAIVLTAFNTAALKHELCTIFLANVNDLIQKIIYNLSFLCIVALYIIFMLGLPLWNTVGMKLGTINMLYSLKTFAILHPYLDPNNGQLPDNGHSLLSPRWPLWRGLTVINT